MQSLPYRQRESASRTGYIPAEEDTLSLGLVTFPPCFLNYVEGPGGTWDPAHPGGSPEEASAKAAAAAAAPPEEPPPPARPAALPRPVPAGRAALGHDGGDVEAALGSQAQAHARGSGGGGVLSWLGSLASRLTGSTGRGAAAGLREPLLAAGSGLRSDSDLSAMWKGGEEGEAPFIPAEVAFVPAQHLVGSAPAVPPEEGRLGMAWLEEPEAGALQAFLREPRKQEGVEAADPVPPGEREERPASRYTSACATCWAALRAGCCVCVRAPNGGWLALWGAGRQPASTGPCDRPPLCHHLLPRAAGAETLHFMARIALAAWPLLALSSALIVASVGLHLYQLRVQVRAACRAPAGRPGARGGVGEAATVARQLRPCCAHAVHAISTAAGPADACPDACPPRCPRPLLCKHTGSRSS